MTNRTGKKPAPQNRTLTLAKTEKEKFSRSLLRLEKKARAQSIANHTICQDIFSAAPLLPDAFVDLLFLDPPYNLDKTFRSNDFKSMGNLEYAMWIDSWLRLLIHTLKPTASIYFCGDWRSSSAIHLVLENYFQVRSRITWEREKGRGARSNWKNSSEDIWFCTASDKYKFDLDAVKLKRRVIAPYRDENGKPKDWHDSGFRLTHPSNFWADITVPFWSMPENTEHPTQKPEKLLAKIILASTSKNNVVLDPFLGSGTTSVVAKKLGRKFVGIEQDETYCCLAEKRLALAENDHTIQGYADGVFWERNTLSSQKGKR
ncbi:MAG TPA: site-specific DNA-methyltransferase [Candidatus Kapabacteria bacterium]|nr:site-specific DNA-methyltransferase [Candidatus Kapabacteria bacterium]